MPQSIPQNRILFQHTFPTPVGDMVCLADEHALYVLDFADNKYLHKKLDYIHHSKNTPLVIGTTTITSLCEDQLTAYFAGNLQTFTIPIHVIGTDFQKHAWQALLQIPYGQTQSYQQQAIAIHNPLACRAVGSANSINRFAIIIPCHRVINKAGTIGNYSGGINRKQWLLAHETSRLAAQP